MTARLPARASRLSVGSDASMVRSAALRMGLLAAGLVALVVVVLTGATAWIVVDAQSDAAESLLSSTVLRADDVGDPPAGVWLTLDGAQGIASTTGTPAGLPDLAAVRAAATSGRPQHTTVRTAATSFEVLTVRRDNGFVAQAALDLRANDVERHQLVTALVTGGLIGLALAAAVGVLLGRRAVRPLADAVALQRHFVADASHELRTPLTLLHTRAQLLERSLARDQAGSQVHADAAGVVTDTRRLAEVVGDLLLAADPRADDEPVDVPGVITEAMGSAAGYAAEQQVTLACDAPASGLTVLASPAALRRALLALLDNAIRHSPVSGVVTVTAGREGRTVRLSVRDDGPGIAGEDIGLVTRRFASGGESAGQRRYGLGLALASEVAARYHGRLDITPSPQPSTVTLTLPALQS